MAPTGRGPLSLISHSWVRIASASASSSMWMTSTSLSSWLVTLCSCSALTFTTIVMRETLLSSVGPTTRWSMLKLRRAKRTETRARTPGLFSTRTDSAWRLGLGLAFIGVPFGAGLCGGWVGGAGRYAVGAVGTSGPGAG